MGNLFASFKDIKIIPGHGGSSHCLWWSTCCSPLWRLLFCRPKPHVTLQALHSDHSDHSPSTAIQYGVLRFDNFLSPILKSHDKFMINDYNFLLPPGREHSVVQHESPSLSWQQHSFMSCGLSQSHVLGMLGINGLPGDICTS